MPIIDPTILKAQQLLTAGKVVAIPTETVYGLAGNAYNEDVILQIFKIKNRPSFDPLIVHASSIDSIKSFVKQFPPQARQLANIFWPGPLTLLLEKKSQIPDLVTAGLPTVGVRIPSHQLTRKLLSLLSFPLAAPSANPFGYISPTTVQHVNDQLGGKIPYTLEGGNCQVGIESTIIGFEQGQPILHRLGGISVEAIEKVIGPVTRVKHATSNPRSPGRLESHYAPRVPLIIGDIQALIRQNAHKNLGILSFDKYYPAVEVKNQAVLSPSSNLDEAAKNLFSSLRTLDQLPIDVILAAYVPDKGLGKAINDRLKRAAVSYF